MPVVGKKSKTKTSKSPPGGKAEEVVTVKGELKGGTTTTIFVMRHVPLAYKMIEFDLESDAVKVKRLLQILPDCKPLLAATTVDELFGQTPNWVVCWMCHMARSKKFLDPTPYFEKEN